MEHLEYERLGVAIGALGLVAFVVGAIIGFVSAWHRCRDDYDQSVRPWRGDHFDKQG